MDHVSARAEGAGSHRSGRTRTGGALTLKLNIPKPPGVICVDSTGSSSVPVEPPAGPR
jgi:hypothetical protein